MNPLHRQFEEIDSNDWCLDASPSQFPHDADYAAKWFRGKHPDAGESELHQFILKVGSRVGSDVSKFDHASQNKTVSDTQIRWAFLDTDSKTDAAKKPGISLGNSTAG